MEFADRIHIKSAGMQLWAAAFARLTTSAEAVDPTRLACSVPRAIQSWSKGEEEEHEGKGKSSCSPALSEVSHLANI